MDRAQLKTIVSGLYDLQALRIMMGNRIVGNFKAKLGQSPGEREEAIDDDGKSLLKQLRAHHNRITDGVAKLPTKKKFVGTELISTYAEFVLVHHYLTMEDAEAQNAKQLKSLVEEFPIWNEWLVDVRGVGPGMAAVLIGTIDIARARYASSLWKYAGLDVVAFWSISSIEPLSGKVTRGMMELIPKESPLKPRATDPFLDAESVELSDDYTKLSVLFRWQDSPNACRVNYELVSKGGRSRRAEHLVEREYTSKDGETKTRRGITFNPFLKTKLVGVLGPSFLKQGADRSPYAKIYYDYKQRMENHAKYGTHRDGERDEDGRRVTSKGRRHNMAIRYAVKMFLADLYAQWRSLEGLPVHPPYDQAKLGCEPHGGRDQDVENVAIDARAVA